ncbi:MAG: hypothetical protein JSV61_13070 [Anaerolineales bacterium]|nr:MAG: hypothetical protein JSV61_13070 [Anaerolineales bacterium]
MENLSTDPSSIEPQNYNTKDTQGEQNKLIAGVVVALIVLLALIIGGVYVLVLPTTDTARVRDIFIIFMALESIIIGLTLIILIVQLARLINLIQNEIKPIMESTNETVSTLRGTTKFLSDNMVEPILKLNEYFAGLQQVIKVIGLARSRDNKK